MKRVTSGTLYGRHGAVRHPTYRIFLDTPRISFDSPPVVLFCDPGGHFVKYRFFFAVFLDCGHTSCRRSISLPQASPLLSGMNQWPNKTMLGNLNV